VALETISMVSWLALALERSLTVGAQGLGVTRLVTTLVYICTHHKTQHSLHNSTNTTLTTFLRMLVWVILAVVQKLQNSHHPVKDQRALNRKEKS